MSTVPTLPVRKAVFPIAGLGTRFLPATKAQPKEMLPVVDKPLIQYAVEEAYEAGVRQMIFVTGRNKRAIEDHFDVAYELESELEAAGKNALIDLVRSIKPDDMDCAYVRQPRALGLGHAVLCAKSLVGNEPFAVLLADDLMVGTPSITAQLVAAYQATGCSVLAVQEVPMAETRKYGVVAPKGGTEGAGLAAASNPGSAACALKVPHGQLIEIAGLVEKPQPHVAPSNLAVAGRYVLTPAVFDRIANQPRGVGGEIQLTDGIAGLLASESVYALRYEGQRYDCGSKLGFLQATVDLAKRHPEVGADFTEWMKAQHCAQG